VPYRVVISAVDNFFVVVIVEVSEWSGRPLMAARVLSRN